MMIHKVAASNRGFVEKPLKTASGIDLELIKSFSNVAWATLIGTNIVLGKNMFPKTAKVLDETQFSLRAMMFLSIPARVKRGELTQGGCAELMSNWCSIIVDLGLLLLRLDSLGLLRIEHLPILPRVVKSSKQLDLCLNVIESLGLLLTAYSSYQSLIDAVNQKSPSKNLQSNQKDLIMLSVNTVIKSMAETVFDLMQIGQATDGVLAFSMGAAGICQIILRDSK